MEQIVVMIPATVQFQPTVTMMEEGHRTARKSIFQIITRQVP